MGIRVYAGAALAMTVTDMADWYRQKDPEGHTAKDIVTECGGYIAQRMLSAKDEKNAIGATMLFNFMHYAIRPWPWIIVALASIICYPTLASIKAQFPGIDPTYLKQDIAYPAMMARARIAWSMRFRILDFGCLVLGLMPVS